MSNGVNPCLKWSSSKSSRTISSKQENINYTFMLQESFSSLSRCNKYAYFTQHSEGKGDNPGVKNIDHFGSGAVNKSLPCNLRLRLAGKVNNRLINKTQYLID